MMHAYDWLFGARTRMLSCILGSVLALAIGKSHGDEPAGWYRGNLHTHSLWSDGNDYPEMICDWYKSEGYHFLGLSDHNILSRGEKWILEDEAAKRGAIDSLKRYRARFGDDWVEIRQKEDKTEVRLKTLDEFRSKFEEPGRFLLLQAEEITDHFGSLPIHVNANNLLEMIRPQGGQSVRETIANNLIAIQQQSQRHGRPILAHLNHPNFGYAVTAEDMAAVIQERFFEVYNGHPGVNHLGDEQRAGVERMWDVANTIRVGEMKMPPLMGLATDDSHNYYGNRDASPGRGWVMVRASKLEADTLIHALEAGQFYASSGVSLSELKYDADSRMLEIAIETEDGASYTTEFVGTRAGYDKSSKPIVDKEGKEITATRRYSADVGQVLAKVTGPTATYQLKGDELYVRAVITSTKPHANPSYEGQMKQAWTQPIGWERHVTKF